MMSKQDREKTRLSRREYDKPRLRTIELAADEVLAIGCKTSTGPGTSPGNPASCVVGVTCSSLGS